MQSSAAEPFPYAGDSLTNLPAWKLGLATVCSILLALLFFVSGSWKLTEPFQWSQILNQFLVPGAVAMPLTLLVGIGEVFSAILIAVPRYRRWGGWLIALMLVGFMGYMGFNYSALAGKDCSCFPLVKRTIGPVFFITDALMLGMATIAAAWSRRSMSIRPLFVILGAVAVFAGVSYEINANQLSGLKAPDSITVDGKPYSLQNGHLFLFFYDPECLHCEAAAKRMAKLNWKDTQVIGIPTRMPQFAEDFLKSTHLKARTSNDSKMLRETFKFVDPPYGVALDRGREKATVVNFDDSEPAKTLRSIGYVE